MMVELQARGKYGESSVEFEQRILRVFLIHLHALLRIAA